MNLLNKLLFGSNLTGLKCVHGSGKTIIKTKSILAFSKTIAGKSAIVPRFRQRNQLRSHGIADINRINCKAIVSFQFLLNWPEVSPAAFPNYPIVQLPKSPYY